MKDMILLAFLIFTFSTISLIAHPNGTYVIDNDKEVTVEFKYLKRCPQKDNAMKGGLRQLSFSSKAEGKDYQFLTGYYVETHTRQGEIYILVNEDCVPYEDDEEFTITATRNTFAGYALKKIK